MPNDTAAIDILEFATNKMDSFLHSWTYWYLTPEENSAHNFVKTLSRTYAQIVAGKLQLMKFSSETSDFVAIFQPLENSQGMKTVIYCNLKLYYETGLEWLVSPSNALTGNLSGNYLTFITTKDGANSKSIQINIRKKMKKKTLNNF